MNIITVWNNNQYFLNLVNILCILIIFIICLILFCSILGFISYVIARIIDRFTVGYKATYITIGDSGEKLLLMNTSDIDGIRSYLIKIQNVESVKYIFSLSTKKTYKVIDGIDLIQVDCYD